MATPNDREYLPLRLLAPYTGVSVRKLRDWLHDPLSPLPHYRLGGKILVKRSDYDAWVQRFKTDETPTGLAGVVDDVLATFR